MNDNDGEETRRTANHVFRGGSIDRSLGRHVRRVKYTHGVPGTLTR